MPQKYKVLPGKKPIAGPQSKAGAGSIPALGSGPRFTPGPWKVIPPGHGLKSQYLCVELDEEQQYATLEMLPADAHLIAAAPELFSALKENLETIECYTVWHNERWPDSEKEECARLTANLRAARSAIAKALGQNA